MKRGFTLVEMLIVIGIIAVLISATLMSFSKMRKNADDARTRELVSEAATALVAIYNADGLWPKAIREGNATDNPGNGGGCLDRKIARILAKRGYISMTMRNDKLAGKDRFGLVTPEAEALIKRNSSVTEEAINGYILRYAVDLDGDGVIRDSECGNRTGETGIRATAVVWCYDKKNNKITSWTHGQTQGIEP